MSSCLFFFFKQKTAYEMRISDWSSDVCSSDLVLDARNRIEFEQPRDIGNDRLGRHLGVDLARAVDASLDHCGREGIHYDGLPLARRPRAGGGRCRRSKAADGPDADIAEPKEIGRAHV